LPDGELRLATRQGRGESIRRDRRRRPIAWRRRVLCRTPPVTEIVPVASEVLGLPTNDAQAPATPTVGARREG
jgi:hypothetical protein